ncbi:hypothetical protein ABIA33_006687 [Streptacidiphilus sp. MAP12-16]|uniref:hypothetical protein n=1 Tax=Streptacidiphilus sp. MAP12-16 TaxID=3156300 RepID=UPI0035169D34
MSDSSATYEVRYGWNRKSVFVLLGSLAFLAAPLLFSQYSSARVDGITVPMPVISVLSALLGLCGVVAGLATVLSRRLALRVDADGVTLGSLPLRSATGEAFVPWEEITAVELWVQHAGRARMPYVGLHRAPGTATLPGAARSRVAQAANTALTGQSAELLAASRPVNFWHLDRPGFLAAVQQNAPTTPVIVAADFP